jgi:hypothetical protein
MRDPANELDRDVARRLFRQHLARSGEILEAHAQAAMAEARGKVSRAAHILRERVKADATLQAEIDALDRLIKHAFPPIELPTPPPMYWPSRLPPSENPKRRTRKARKSHAKKT